MDGSQENVKGSIVIEVRDCKYGRGVFATRAIKKGEVVEISPVIVIPKTQAEFINETLLHLYVYDWKKEN